MNLFIRGRRQGYFMMRRLIVLLVFTFVVSVAGAQQMFVSPDAHDDFSLGYSKVIGQDDGGFYVLSSNLSLSITNDRVGLRNRKYQLAYFTSTLIRKWSIPVVGKNESVPDAVSFFNDRVMIVSSAYDKSEGKVSYSVSFVDSSSKIESIPVPVAVIAGIKGDYEKAKVIVSSSRSLFAIATREFSGESAGKLHAVIIDDQLKSSGVKSGTVSYEEKNFEISDYALSNEGDLVILALNSERVKLLSSKRKNDYLLYSAPSESSVFFEQNISGEISITGIGVAFDNINRKAVLAGFYAEKDSYIGAGIYYATLGMESGDSVKIATRGLDGQANIRLRGERNRGSSLDLVSYPIDRIVPRQDGGAVIVAEAAYTTEYSFYDSFSQSFSRRLEYNFENIIIISINSSGAADWSTIVEKRQSSLDDGGMFSSFCSMLNSEQIGIVFNDQISRRGRILPVTINNMGKSEIMKPFPQKEGMLILPRGGKQISENEMVVPALIKRKLYFVKFVF